MLLPRLMHRCLLPTMGGSFGKLLLQGCMHFLLKNNYYINSMKMVSEWREYYICFLSYKSQQRIWLQWELNFDILYHDEGWSCGFIFKPIHTPFDLWSVWVELYWNVWKQRIGYLPGFDFAWFPIWYLVLLLPSPSV